MKTIGIIGGISFESTITYYKLINEEIAKKLGGLNSAKIILHSVNFKEIEKYQSQNLWDESAKILSLCAKKLENAGADFIIIATNTMHKIYDDVQMQVKIPILHIATSTAKALQQANINQVGLIGTKYTMNENFYKEKLLDQGIKTLIPCQKDMQIVNEIIFDELCRGIFKESSKKTYLEIVDKLRQQGALGIILACTEIGLLIKQEDTQIPLFDTSILHALDAANQALS
ncbi:aspartate/glutamate racemase family protein [Campylobacter sp. US33a]|uniref:aspartate/glutamate racemase family protein n=1 Tax=Campylobacter sp. US33a TaxID=2498120 RepID=UPI001067E46C|nr:aspartate/glutamate racemase family protein [Campylobacter sp. US33a]TEY04467.1 aspartate/glutamate racemase family protein [Campylobacter sp. US33a]